MKPTLYFGLTTLLLVSFSAAAESPQQATDTQTAVASGMTVTIDPEKRAAGEDGFVVPDPDAPRAEGAPVLGGEDTPQALSNMVSTSTEGLVQEQKADGTVVVDLQGRFQSAMTAQIGDDGQLVTRCYSDDPNHSHPEGSNVIHPDKTDNSR